MIKLKSEDGLIFELDESSLTEVYRIDLYRILKWSYHVATRTGSAKSPCVQDVYFAVDHDYNIIVSSQNYDDAFLTIQAYRMIEIL